MPDRNGRLIEELGQALKPDSLEYTNFFQWANETKSNGLSQIFPASLLVHERSTDLELNSEIENFWAGDRILISRVKSGLRQIGQMKSYSFRAPKAADLPPQRLRFLVELVKAAGYKDGWCCWTRSNWLVRTPSCSAAGLTLSWPVGLDRPLVRVIRDW